jgi:hypothetical protein
MLTIHAMQIAFSICCIRSALYMTNKLDYSPWSSFLLPECIGVTVFIHSVVLRQVRSLFILQSVLRQVRSLFIL